MMSPEENKSLVCSHYEELTNRKNLAAADEQIAFDFIDHEAPPFIPRGPEGVKQWLRLVYTAFPDITVTLEDVVAESDIVALRATWRGTHQGLFMGIEGTGRPFTLQGMVFCRIDRGKIAERWAVLDQAGLLQRLRLGTRD